MRNFVETARRQDLSETPDASHWRGHHVWLIRHDSDPLAAACVGYFGEAGAQVTETDYAALQDARPQAVSHVLVVVPHADRVVTVDGLSQFVGALQGATLSALNINGTDPKPSIVYVQPHYIRYPQREAESSPFSVNAYVSSLVLEQPNLDCRVINVSHKALEQGESLAQLSLFAPKSPHFQLKLPSNPLMLEGWERHNGW